MRICVAQTNAFKGDIRRNIDAHIKLIEIAAQLHPDLIIFPELSLTGYEPTLANELAVQLHDKRLDIFQKISDSKNITIGTGVPLKNDPRPAISMILFAPHAARQVYSKKYLHSDEDPFFYSGQSTVGLIGNSHNIALAICYELSVPEHSKNAFKNGAKIYIASVAKTIKGVEKAIDRLSEIASTYSMTILMSNCVGVADGEICGGRSSVWDDKGTVKDQLDDQAEGFLILDTESHEVIKEIL